MRSKILLVILIVVVLVAAVFLALDRAHAPTVPATVSTASSTTGLISSTSTISSIDTSSWTSYVNAKPPFVIKYPADLVSSTSTVPTIEGTYLLELQFPASVYFSTVLKDQAYVIVTASSTCPAVAPGPIDHGPQTLEMNSMSFTENEASDVGAGNIYHTITYDTLANGLCYRVTFFDHGANGAGLYLSDPTEIQAADTTHAAELSRVEAIVQAMVGTLSLYASK